MVNTSIDRHRTALTRHQLSRPVQLALSDGLLSPETSAFDYGCGRGGDLRILQRRGFDCDGWDPAHRANATKRIADVVNLGYVVNVIEDPRERIDTLKEAWRLTAKLLVVSAQRTADSKKV
ncbi:unnamed protein product, partial [marine sediment metagenome]